jgi:hypothetical protein
MDRSIRFSRCSRGIGLALRWVSVGVGLAWLFAGEPARADGAFPDASRILLPPGEPQAITLATNFGVISTSDDGASWTWSCETPLLNGGRGYQLTADEAGRPRRLVALSSWGLVHSDDAACTWTPSQGAGEDDSFSDVFVSAASPARAWAIGADPGQAMGLAQVLFTSADGAATLSGPLFQVQGDDQLLGVESALPDPATIYVTVAGGADNPSLAVTHDGGGHWETRPLASAVGSGYLRILSVDARSANTVYLRQSTTTGDRLLVTRDGGLTWQVGLSLTGSLSAFLQRSDGTLLVGVLEADDQTSGYRSSDAGRTFLPWPGVPHLRALAERDGILFAAADDIRDGFALGTSVDGGATFRPRLRYAQVSAVAACVRSACRLSCENLATIGLWPSGLCLDPGLDPGPGPGPGPGPDAGAAGPDSSAERTPSSGGGCVVAGNASRGIVWGDVLAAIAALALALAGLGFSSGRRRAAHP